MVLIVHMLWNDGYAPNSVFEIPTKVELFFFFLNREPFTVGRYKEPLRVPLKGETE